MQDVQEVTQDATPAPVAEVAKDTRPNLSDTLHAQGLKENRNVSAQYVANRVSAEREQGRIPKGRIHVITRAFSYTRGDTEVNGQTAPFDVAVFTRVPGKKERAVLRSIGADGRFLHDVPARATLPLEHGRGNVWYWTPFPMRLNKNQTLDGILEGSASF